MLGHATLLSSGTYSLTCLLNTWKAKLPEPSAVQLAPGSTLVLRGDLSGLTIESLALSGTLVVDLAPGAVVTLKSVKERNAGWAFKDLAEGEEVPEPLAIRGYTLLKNGQRELSFDKGTHVVDEPATVDCGSCGVQ